MVRRVFLAVEGPNDGGALGRSPGTRDNDPRNEGALQPLVRRMVGNDAVIRGQSTSQLFLKDFPEPEDARGRRAMLASRLAALDGCDILVFHSDVDAGSDESDPQVAWSDCSSAVADGFDLASTDGGLAPDRCVGALPCRVIEAWLLADHAAIAARRSPDSLDEDAAVARPEALWEHNRPGTPHPKHVLRRAIGGRRRPRVASSDYSALAAASDVDTLATRCPISFPPFRDALVRAASA